MRAARFGALIPKQKLISRTKHCGNSEPDQSVQFRVVISAALSLAAALILPVYIDCPAR